MGRPSTLEHAALTASVEHGAAQGFAVSEFEAVREAFTSLLSERSGWSGAFAACLRGRLVVDLWGGPDWHEDSVVFLASATKGVAATCIAVLVDDGLIDADEPVASYWPEFAAAGKGSVTMSVLLSHQAGLLAVEEPTTLADILAHGAFASRLAAQRPAWRPGSTHSYHGVTLGSLMDEVVRRVTGRPLRTFFAERVAIPTGVSSDLYLGLPESEDARLVLTVEPERTPEDERQEADAMAHYDAWLRNHELARLPSDVALDRIARLEEVEAVRRSGWASGAGIGNARGLARMYAACVSDVDGFRLLHPETARLMSLPHAHGEDAIFGVRSAFGIGYAVPVRGDGMAGVGSFGHGGAGGSTGFAHPDHELAIGFTTSHVPSIAGHDPAVDELTAVVLRCAGIEVTSRC